MEGSCLCGAVAFALEGPLELMNHCHCGMCRKAHGSDFATYVGGPASGFRLLRGEEHIRRYESSPGHRRAFCGRCGSVLPPPQEGAPQVFVPAGLLDGDPGVRPVAHIFAASRAPWTLLDELPAFDAMAPGYETPRVAPRPPLPEARAGALRGSCLCDGVRFVVTETPTQLRHCHCGRCRKARAAAFATNLFAPAEAVRFTRGETLLERFPVPGARFFVHVFCRTCGSPMPRVDPGRGVAVIPAGALDDDPGLRPASHIFVASRAPWHTIADALPQHAEYETPA